MRDSVMQRHQLKAGEPASSQLVRILREAIVRLEIRPGDRISEQEIADAFGLSRHPVREALLQLRDTGLIQSLPRRGTQVLRISIAGVRAACLVREALECAAARRASAEGCPNALKAVRYCLALQRVAADGNDIEHFHRLDDEFHRLITVAAEFELAWKIVEEHKAQIDRIRYIKLQRAKAQDPSYRNLYDVNIGEHERILEAIVDHQADEAEALVRHHTTKILGALPKLQADYPEMFEREGGAEESVLSA
jgi:DNA-binding GntR family transcriptional regulator